MHDLLISTSLETEEFQRKPLIYHRQNFRSSCFMMLNIDLFVQHSSSPIILANRIRPVPCIHLFLSSAIRPMWGSNLAWSKNLLVVWYNVHLIAIGPNYTTTGATFTVGLIMWGKYSRIFQIWSIQCCVALWLGEV